MKLMKHIMIALVLCAIPAMAIGQAGVAEPVTVDTACGANCWTAPFYKGEGGFVGESATADNPKTTTKDESLVSFAVTCGSVTTSGSAAPDADGVVRQAFTMDNGLACNAPDGKIEIDNLKAGGWYWINDDVNSAVASLVAEDTLTNDEVTPTDPGGVTFSKMTGGKASYVEHATSGRVGILQHILPVAPPAMCGTATSDCMLGSSAGTLAMTMPGTGAKPVVKIAAGGTVDRPATGKLVVTVKVDGGTTGRITIASATAAKGVLKVDPPKDKVLKGVKVDQQINLTTSVGSIDVMSDTRCAANSQQRDGLERVNVTLSGFDDGKLPAPKPKLETHFMVGCAALTAASGQELVPDNPFPTTVN